MYFYFLQFFQDDNIENSKGFKEFVEKAKGRNYFQGCVEGSDEYKRKYDILLKKYSEAHSKTNTQPQQQPPQQKPAGDKVMADKYKEEGNALLKSNDYKGAYDAYTKAINCYPDGTGAHIYYSNRGAASMYLEDYDKVIDDCNKALAIDPTFMRAHTRLGKAYICQKRYQDAIECLEKAKRLDPDNNDVNNLLKEARGKEDKRSYNPSAQVPQGLDGLLNNPALRSISFFYKKL